jgi:ferrous iron transport protein B
MEKKPPKLTLGLTGNPNIGKSTLFNALTGARQHVGNWPGKTVEKKEGTFTYKNKKIKLVDLPGSYSLAAYSEEETITTEFILKEKPDVVVQIVDTQNLERNLFMTIQLIELQTPLVLALNMADLAKKDGIEIDAKQLSILLNIPVVIIDAKRKKGINELMDAVVEQSSSDKRSKVKLTYGTEIDAKLKTNPTRLEKKSSKNINNALANTRYGFIKGLSREVIKRDKTRKKQNISDSVDNLLMNKLLGIPLFLIVAWLMFQATFTLSGPFMDWIELLFGFIGETVSTLMTSWQSPAWVISLIVDGIIGGVGGILVFVPIIAILFLIMAILEDSGYMARVAYVMDKLMHRIGLHGKAFLPMILGFGCNVPGIMATRTLETKKDRLLTILINPFMSCGARLPVYALFAGVFFSAHQGWVIFSLYLLGVMVAIIMGFIFKKIFSKGLSSPFVIELPPYRWPSITGLLLHVWEKIWMFIKKAGTIILAFSVIIWALASFPAGVEYGSQESLAGQMGETISPVFEPLGFGNWQSSVALIFGFVAKEVIVGTFGTLYGVEDISEPGAIGADASDMTVSASSLTDALQNDFTPLSAYAFMVFVLLYIPCMAVLAVVKRETNSWKWPLFMVAYTTGIAWILAFIVYQGGKLLGFN